MRWLGLVGSLSWALVWLLPASGPGTSSWRESSNFKVAMANPLVHYIRQPPRHQGCDHQGGDGPGPVCSQLSLRLCNSSVHTSGAGHQGHKRQPLPKLYRHRLDQLEDLACYSTHQLLLCAFPASDTGERLKMLSFVMFIVHYVNIGSKLLGHLPGNPNLPIR